MTYELNQLVEQHGLFAVLDHLAGICGKECETASSNMAAESWQAAETAIDKAASAVLDLFVHA